MKSSQKKRQTLTVVALFAIMVAIGCMGLYFKGTTLREAGLQKDNMPVRVTAAQNGVALQESRETLAAVSENTALVESHEQDMPAPAWQDIGAVLPDIAAPVNDWREYRPKTIKIALNPELMVDFDMVDIREEHDRTIMTGRNPSLPGAFFTSVATKDKLHAVVSVTSLGSYKIDATNTHAAIEEQNRPVMCAMEHPVPNPHEEFPRVNDSNNITPAGTAVPDETALGADVMTVDVLFFYDRPLAQSEDRESIVSEFVLQMNAANIILENSRIDSFRWRYMDAYEAPQYTETIKMQDDLYQMSDPTTTLGAFVQKKRKERVADQCVLYVNNRRSDAAGIAWMPGHDLVVGWKSYGIATYKTLTHEMGHNFGCHHDRITANARDNDGAYNYGWGIKESGKYLGTIMSYASVSGTPPAFPEEFPYFSNPSLTVEGYVIGYEEGHPQAADNARVIRASAPAMAAAGKPGSPAEVPRITTQPQSVTVSVGRSFALSVSAASNSDAGAVLYQWKKGVADIVGATGPELSFGAAASTMDGIYYAVVSNDAGFVTSRPATVFVTTLDVPTTYSDNNGGGAPSPWYFSGTGLLFAAWLLKRKK
jgi:hypothetical protein